MTFERDYIKRLIEQMGDFFRGLGEKLDDAEVILRLDSLCRQRCGLPLRVAHELTWESLRDMLPEEARLTLTLLLREEAERTVHNDTDKTELWLKALRLLLSLGENGAVCEQCCDGLDTLMRAVLGRLTPEELIACGLFFHSGGRFDRMDNAAYFLWDTLPPAGQAAWREDILRLYAPLRTMNDAQLKRGDFSRAELAESLAGLMKISG